MAEGDFQQQSAMEENVKHVPSGVRGNFINVQLTLGL
jgi:hypothetical protein